MANFIAKYCAPSPVVDVLVATTDDKTLRSTTYRGLVDVTVDTDAGPTLTEGVLQFVLPDSLPYTAAQLPSATLSCSATPVGLSPITADTRTSVGLVAADLVDDPRNPGASAVRLSVTLQTTNLLPAWTTRLSYEVQTLVRG